MSRPVFALGVPTAMAADAVLFALLRRARPQPFGLISPAVYPAMLRSAGQIELRSFSSVSVTAHDSCEAFRFARDSPVVTAVARLGFSHRPQFDLVSDLEPYMAEHRDSFSAGFGSGKRDTEHLLAE